MTATAAKFIITILLIRNHNLTAKETCFLICIAIISIPLFAIVLALFFNGFKSKKNLISAQDAN